jgi:tetratricopeptide (TPR) repeat protein
MPSHRWQRPVCERVTAAASEYVSLPIRHHGYTSAISRYAKLDRNRLLLERAVAAAPGDPEIRQRLAWTMLVLGDPYAAAAHAEAALRRTRSTMTGLLAIDTLARARMSAGDLRGAANACRTALALRPDWIDPRLVLAEASQRAGKVEEALLHYARFLLDRQRLLDDVTWPVRLPRLSSLTAEPAARAELASVHAAMHRADSRHDVLVGTA